LFELDHAGTSVEGWESQFCAEVEDYWRLLLEVDPQEIAPPPILGYFSLVLRFHLRVEPVERIGEACRHSYREFNCRTHAKVDVSDYLDVAIQEIERERRNFARPDHHLRACALANAILAELGIDERFKPYRAAIHNLLADIAYFFPLSDQSEAKRYELVQQHLRDALTESPHDQFAINLEKHVRLLASTNLQIQRFGHDTGTRMGNIDTLLVRLVHLCPPTEQLHISLAALRREFDSLRAMGRLILGKQPSEKDWKHVDIAEIILPLLEERKWPAACLRRVGTLQCWLVCPDLLRLVFDNLLRNTEEAYSRQKIAKPESPGILTIDYSSRTVTCADFAGGIDATLGDVFEPYRSSKGVFSNVGLGLTQAREAMRLQQFSIQLADLQPEGGAEFVLRFPHETLP
jgi:signal transduction histidine kinase